MPRWRTCPGAALQRPHRDVQGAEEIHRVLPQLLVPGGALLRLADHDHLLLLKLVDHTLNNTVVAPPRMLIAFLENNLREDGSVAVPVALRPYMGGQEALAPVKK